MKTVSLVVSLSMMTLCSLSSTTMAFQQQIQMMIPQKVGGMSTTSRSKTLQLSARNNFGGDQGFDPLGLASADPLKSSSFLATTTRNNNNNNNNSCDNNNNNNQATAAAAAVFSTIWMADNTANAYELNLSNMKQGMTVENFKPICSASDGFYRVLQQTVMGLVGPEKFSEYGPLIAGGLLRVRLELCVVESFFNEAVGPFIRDNGVSWVLPWHETVETFLAGGIFAVATTFILIGSTKLLTVIVTYTDFLLGFPARLFGGFAFDRAQGKPVTLDIGFGPFKKRMIGPPALKEGEISDNEFKIADASAPAIVVLVLSGIVNYFGQGLKLVREVLEAVDSFVGRYLVLWASAYLLIKFVHFKIFPDFP